MSKWPSEDFFVQKNTSFGLLGHWRWRIAQTLGPSTQEILPVLRALTHEAKLTLDSPRHGAPGCQRCELLGQFEEEEEGIGIASDIVKVDGEYRPSQIV